MASQFIRFYTTVWVNLPKGPFITNDPANRTVQYCVVRSLCLGEVVWKTGEVLGGHRHWNCSQLNKATSHTSEGEGRSSTRIFAYSVAHLKCWEKKKPTCLALSWGSQCVYCLIKYPDENQKISLQTDELCDLASVCVCEIRFTWLFKPLLRCNFLM